MFIKTTHLNNYQNEEHYAFHTYVEELLDDPTLPVPKIGQQRAVYKSLLPKERQALDKVKKSAFTARLDAANDARNKPIIGFYKVSAGMLNHFNPEVSAAAYRVSVVNDKFKGITRLPKERKTVAIHKYLDALKAIMPDLVLLGLADWYPEIEAQNNGYVNLKKSQFAEKDEQITLKMKEVRVEVDDAYDTIKDRINAYVTIDCDAEFGSFITKLNNRIYSFNLLLAQREGRKKKDDDEPTEPTEPTDPADPTEPTDDTKTKK